MPLSRFNHLWAPPSSSDSTRYVTRFRPSHQSYQLSTSRAAFQPSFHPPTGPSHCIHQLWIHTKFHLNLLLISIYLISIYLISLYQIRIIFIFIWIISSMISTHWFGCTYDNTIQAINKLNRVRKQLFALTQTFFLFSTHVNLARTNLGTEVSMTLLGGALRIWLHYSSYRQI